jgi:enterochelin esterase-like enzyme
VPQHRFDPLAGRVVYRTWDSPALRGNLVGDPSRRTVAVYLPPGYDDTDRDYPLFVELAAFTGSGLKRLGWQAFGESVPQRIERLVAEGRMGPVVAAFPDAFTSLGGNQYVDTPVLGRWETWLVDETVPRLEDEFRLRRGARHRAVYGKSSGGYGALVQGMRHGDRWGAVASHSGDVGFDLAYFPDLPGSLDVFAEHGFDPASFVEAARTAARMDGSTLHALMTLALAGSYDPDPSAPLGLRLPVDPETCERIPERWAAWLRHDPLAMAEDPACLESLRRLRLLFLDCGNRDEYRLHYGLRALVRKLRAAGVPFEHEEFDGGHSGIDFRLDRSLPALYGAITRDA